MKIPIKLKKMADNYDIAFTEDVKNSLLMGFKGYGRYVIITDSKVNKSYSKLLRDIKKSLGAELIIIPSGERSKNSAMKGKIENSMLKKGCGRDTLIIAFGGGVVGDLSGFVAATFCRGIDYVQVPTTLLAMVDSSIGGKVAIDTPYGKNLIGAFHQPKRVYVSIAFLKTLPKKELRNGISEIIKYGVIADKQLFEFLEKNCNNIMNLERNALTYVISKSCMIKKDVVEKDEKEENLRKVLNFGHTIGHAVELSSNYRIAHGEAVSIGMFYESRIAERCELLKSKDVKRLESLIGKFGLHSKMKMDARKIVNLTKADKKARGGYAQYALPAGIGKMKKSNGKYAFPIPDKVVMEALKDG